MSSLSNLCVFVVCKLYNNAHSCLVYADIQSLLSCTNEPQYVTILAIYYIIYLKQTNILHDLGTVRNIYVSAFNLAIKYVDDYRVLQAQKLSNFLNVTIDDFNKMEAITMRHLQYSLDPGYQVLYQLSYKVATAYKKTFLHDSHKFSSASEYKSLSSSFSGMNGFGAAPLVSVVLP